MLVVEYLDGGTLRDSIRSGPVSYAEAIELGIVLADVSSIACMPRACCTAT